MHSILRSSGIRSLLPALATAAGTALVSGFAQAAILDNGSFESPNVGGSYQTFATGASIGAGGAWDSVATGGASGNVAVVSGSSSSGGFALNAQSGSQWLDLTGDGSNSTLGVEQSFPTTVNGSYLLSFSVGNVVDNGGALGTASGVRVYVDGVLLDTYSNGLGTGGASIAWQTFNVPFTAATGTTTVRFINDDPAGDNLNGLDNVQVTRADAPAGGGGAVQLVFLGALLLAGIRRRRVA